ncbi:unnamed protein product [Blepharisma stoltei]|uniref:OTU domain-containing protein n=1 Tax=Blepharisma stoltei TaxID=1481888 RepID=A0AAU9IKT3_9CILI|nr:unnamed protein product [Blepharisma stoltei]
MPVKSPNRKDLVIIPMKGDGNCMFRAISCHLTGFQESHRDIRNLVADYFEKNEERYKEILEDGLKTEEMCEFTM